VATVATTAQIGYDSGYTAQPPLAPWKPAAKPVTFLAFFDSVGYGGSSNFFAAVTHGSSGLQVWNTYGANARRVQVYSASGVSAFIETGTWAAGPQVRGLTHDGATLIGYDSGRQFGSTADATSAIYYDASFTSVKMLANTGGTGYWMALWNRVLTPAAVAALNANPWQMFAGPQSRIWVPVGAGGIAVGVAMETATALAPPAKQSRAPGIAVESASALALSPLQSMPVGAAMETATALAPLAMQSRTVGMASETGTALALPAGASAPVGLATELGTALACGAVQRRAPGIAVEGAAALALAGGAANGIGMAVDTSSALALSARHVKTVGMAAESSAALALPALQVRAVGMALESATALALPTVQRRGCGLATELSTALTPAASAVAAPVRAPRPITLRTRASQTVLAMARPARGVGSILNH
jgi:hypothetical protein